MNEVKLVAFEGKNCWGQKLQAVYLWGDEGFDSPDTKYVGYAYQSSYGKRWVADPYFHRWATGDERGQPISGANVPDLLRHAAFVHRKNVLKEHMNLLHYDKKGGE